MTAAEIASKGIAAITIPYVARVLGVEGFGIIGVSEAWAIFFSTAVVAGYNTIGSREIARNPDKTKLYTDAIVTVRMITAVIGYALLAFLVYFVSDQPSNVRFVIMIAGLNVFVQAFLLDFVYQGLEKMEFIAVRQVLTGVLNLGGMLLLVNGPEDVALAKGVTIAAWALNSFWLFGAYIKKFGIVKPKIEKKLTWSIVKSSLPITFNNFLIIIYNYVGILLLGEFKSEEEAGLYTSAFKLVYLATLIGVVLQKVFLPLLSRAESREERVKAMEKYSLLLFVPGAILAFGFLTFADPAILIFYGAEYEASIPTMRILSVSIALTYLNVSLTLPLIAWGYERPLMYAMIAGGIANVAANLLLIPTFAQNGAGFASVIGETAVYVIAAIVFYPILKRIFILNMLKLSLLAAASCGVGYVFHLLGLWEVAAAFLSAIIYSAFVFIFKFITFNDLRGFVKK